MLQNTSGEKKRRQGFQQLNNHYNPLRLQADSDFCLSYLLICSTSDFVMFWTEQIAKISPLGNRVLIIRDKHPIKFQKCFSHVYKAHSTGCICTLLKYIFPAFALLVTTNFVINLLLANVCSVSPTAYSDSS